MRGCIPRTAYSGDPCGRLFDFPMGALPSRAVPFISEKWSMFPVLQYTFGSLGWYAKQGCQSLEVSVVCRCRRLRVDRNRSRHARGAAGADTESAPSDLQSASLLVIAAVHASDFYWRDSGLAPTLNAQSEKSLQDSPADSRSRYSNPLHKNGSNAMRCRPTRG
jgi:hypothetical protein